MRFSLSVLSANSPDPSSLAALQIFCQRSPRRRGSANREGLRQQAPLGARGMQDFVFAIRRWLDFCPVTRTEMMLIDRMVRRGDWFFLIEEPEKRGEPEVEKPCSLEEVFEWLNEWPETIERTVITNSSPCHPT